MSAFEKFLTIASIIFFLAEVHILSVAYLVKNSSNTSGISDIGIAVYFSSGPLVLFLSIPFIILLMIFTIMSFLRSRKPTSFLGCVSTALSVLLLFPAFNVFANSFLNFPN